MTRFCPGDVPVSPTPTFRDARKPPSPGQIYKVKRVHVAVGLRWVVVKDGMYLFVQIEKEKADNIAEKMNRIYQRRMGIEEEETV